MDGKAITQDRNLSGASGETLQRVSMMAVENHRNASLSSRYVKEITHRAAEKFHRTATPVWVRLLKTKGCAPSGTDVCSPFHVRETIDGVSAAVAEPNHSDIHTISPNIAHTRLVNFILALYDSAKLHSVT